MNAGEIAVQVRCQSLASLNDWRTIDVGPIKNKIQGINICYTKIYEEDVPPENIRVRTDKEIIIFGRNSFDEIDYLYQSRNA